jgi:hypothetical protein
MALDDVFSHNCGTIPIRAFYEYIGDQPADQTLGCCFTEQTNIINRRKGRKNGGTVPVPIDGTPGPFDAPDGRIGI